MRPVVPRPHLAQPAPRFPALPARLGWASPPPRLDMTRHYVPTWSELINLDISVLAGATEARGSKLIHNPFRIDAFGGQFRASINTGILWILQVTQGDETDVEVEAARSPLFSGSRTDNAQMDSNYAAIHYPMPTMGQVVQRYPSRLMAIVVNTSASTESGNVFISITHLRCAEAGDYPAAPAAA